MLAYTSMKTWVFLFIVIRGFVEGAGTHFILPTAWYYIKSLGQTKAFLGLVLSALSISAIFAGPIVGRLSDRYGHAKFIIVVCFFLKVLGYLVYSIPASPYFPLAGRFIAGLADGSYGIFFSQLALYTEEKYRAKVFIFVNGIYILGAVVGPGVSSFLVFDVDIFGWRINPGNSPGVVLALMWLAMSIVSLWLPDKLGYDIDKSPVEKAVLDCDDEEDDDDDKDLFGSEEKCRSFSSIFCVFYLIFLGVFYSTVVTFYIPLLTEQHFHLQLTHSKLLFVIGGMFCFALFLFLYIVAEFFDERQLLAFLMLLQTVAILILTYYAIYWRNVSWNDCYLLIIFICSGMPSFATSYGCSVLSKVTDPKDAAFYQGSSFATLHVACIAGRCISGLIFTQTSLLFFCLALIVSCLVGAVWFYQEYHKLAPRGVSQK